MSSDEQRTAAEKALAFYGFTLIESPYIIKMELQNSRCSVWIFCYDYRTSVQFKGDTINTESEQIYDLTEKSEVNKFRTRIRNVAKKALAFEEVQTLADDTQIKEYQAIANVLVDKHLAFAMNIRKCALSSAAVIEVNGHNVKFRNIDGTVAVNIGGSRVQVTGELALTLAGLLPTNDKNFN